MSASEVRQWKIEVCACGEMIVEGFEYGHADHGGSEMVAVVPAAELEKAVTAARRFNRSGMTWLEYDAELVRLERIARVLP